MTKPEPQQEFQSAEQKLEAIRAKRQQIALDRAEHAKQQQLTLELEREQQALQDDEAIAKLELEHPVRRIKIVETQAGRIVVQRPRAVEYQRFADRGDTSYQTIVSFVKPCLLYPTQQRFDAMLDEQAGIIGPVSSAVVELAGVEVKEKGSK